MALSLVCGAECQIHSTGSGAAADSHWSNATGASVVTSPVRSGTYAYQVTNGQLAHKHDTGATAVYLRYYFRFATLPSNDFEISFVSATNDAKIYFDQSVGDVGVLIGNVTPLDSSTNNFSPSTDTWYGIEMEVQPNTGGVKWRTWTDAGGWTTSETVGASMGAFLGTVGLSDTDTGTVYFDDIAIGEEVTLGDFYDDTSTNGVSGKVLRLNPTSDGTHNIGTTGDFTHTDGGGTNDAADADTDLWTYLDEADMEQSTFSINTTGLVAAGEYVNVNFADESTEDDPRGVSVVVHQSAVSGGAVNGISVSDNGTDETDLGYALASQDGLWQEVLPLAPSGAAWTRALVNSTEALIGRSDYAAKTHGIALEVEWTATYTGPKFATSTTASGTTTDITIAKPTGTEEGDFLVAVVQEIASSTWDAESGWTLDAPDLYYGLYYKVAGASEPANYTFEHGGNSISVGAMARITGANASTPVKAIPSSVYDDASPTTFDAPASGTVPLGDYLGMVLMGHYRSGGTYNPNPPTDYTEQADLLNDSVGAWIGTRELRAITSEDPGTGTFDTGSLNDCMTWTLLIGAAITYHDIPPTDDVTTTGWTSTPLWSKIDDDPDSPDATVISGTAS